MLSSRCGYDLDVVPTDAGCAGWCCDDFTVEAAVVAGTGPLPLAPQVHHTDVGAIEIMMMVMDDGLPLFSFLMMTTF